MPKLSDKSITYIVITLFYRVKNLEDHLQTKMIFVTRMCVYNSKLFSTKTFKYN